MKRMRVSEIKERKKFLICKVPYDEIYLNRKMFYDEWK
jgi:hypothetical protein